MLAHQVTVGNPGNKDTQLSPTPAGGSRLCLTFVTYRNSLKKKNSGTAQQLYCPLVANSSKAWAKLPKMFYIDFRDFY